MAKIVKSNLQLEALKFVNDGIKMIEKINKMLKETVIEKCALNIKINSGKVLLDDSDFTIKVLHSLKRDIFNKIKRKCNKFSIELDDKDKEILGIIEKEIEAEMEQGLEAVEKETDDEAEILDEQEQTEEQNNEDLSEMEQDTEDKQSETEINTEDEEIDLYDSENDDNNEYY